MGAMIWYSSRVGVERPVVQNVLGARPSRDGAALVARFAQDALRFEDAFARLLRVSVGVPLHELVSATIGNDDAAHG